MRRALHSCWHLASTRSTVGVVTTIINHSHCHYSGAQPERLPSCPSSWCLPCAKPVPVLACRSRKDSLESDSSTAIIPHELIRTRQLESVHLKFNQESGALIPLCLR